MDLMHDLTAELGGNLTASEDVRLRRVVGQLIHAERLDAAGMQGQHVDTEQLVRLSNSASREIAKLKAGRAASAKRPKGRTIHDVLADKAAA